MPYDVLLVTSRQDLTADLLVTRLQKRGINYLRLNCEDFPTRFGLSWTPKDGGRMASTNREEICLSNIKSAWFRRTPPPLLPIEIQSEGIRHFVASEVGSFLEGLWNTTTSFWVNRPSKVRCGENKLIQLQIARSLNLAIPETLVTNDPVLVRKFASGRKSVIAKSLAVGVLEHAGSRWSICSQDLLEDELLDDHSIQAAPIIIQERVKKLAEVRVTIVGGRLFSTKIILEGGGNDVPDWHEVNDSLVKYERHKIPPALSAICLQMVRTLGLVYSALDFILTPTGEYVFLEINPSGQWGWIEQETEYSITDELVNVLVRGRVN